MKTQITKLPNYREAADIFELFKEDTGVAFLDSALTNRFGRYSIIGLNPCAIFEERDKCFFYNSKPQAFSFEEGLADYLRTHYEVNDTDLPLTAGAIGYFSYDYGRKFENIHSRHKKILDIPDACFIFYDNLIIEDTLEKVLYVTARGELIPPEKSTQALIRQIEAAPPRVLPTKNKHLAPFTANFTKEAYKETIDRMIQYIIEGDIYIANMTQQLEVKSTRHPYDAYRYLRQFNPAPFASYFNYGDFQIVSASLERFLKVKDGQIETRPIKGTRRRGDTPEEDAALRQELSDSGKDKSELLMVVDLERNDLNHICIPGSVVVTDHFAVEAYATVFHLVSTITGTLKPQCDLSHLLQATFPGGSITGTPKIRTMEIIDELEHGRRGLYTGSIGYLALDGSCDFNIVIRTAVHQNGSYHLGVGGGITCESDLEFEYEETLQKAKAVLEALSED